MPARSVLALAALALAACHHDVDDAFGANGGDVVGGTMVLEDAFLPSALVPLGGTPDIVRAPLTLVLAVDGIVVKPGPWAVNNAQTSTSSIVAHEVAVPPMDMAAFGGRDAALAAIRAEVLRHFGGFIVDVTYTRPAFGPYTVVVMGGRAEDVGLAPGPLGVAPFDVDNLNPNDVAFVFTAAGAQFGYTPQGLANAVSHEVGHTLGLDHVAPLADVMAPVVCHCAASFGAGPLAHDAARFQDDVALLRSVLLEAPAAQGCGFAPPGFVFAKEQRLVSCNGRFALVHQNDGNVVLYEGTAALWATNTWGQQTSQLVMQHDGNLVLYAPAGALWSSATWGHDGASLRVQDDGDVVISDPAGTRLWATGTAR